VHVAAAPRAGVEVVFDVGVAAEGRNALDGRARERRAAEVRVEDHPGRVDDRLQRGHGQFGQPRGDGAFDRRGHVFVIRFACRRAAAQRVGFGAQRVDQGGAAEFCF
jgi:hypothetical protein